MWICAICEAQNDDSARFCVCCGNAKKEKAAQKSQTPQETGPESGAAETAVHIGKGKKPSKLLKILGLSFAALIVLLITGYFTIHIWTPASCTTPETCAICGKTRAPAAGHKWIAASCTEPAVCSVCGVKSGEPAGHQWVDATCTEPETCTVCGATRGAALGHKWKDATCTEAETCTVCGATRSPAKGHSWKSATCTEPETCSVCGATRGSALGHDWQEASYDTPKTCRRCGIRSGSVKGYVGDLTGSFTKDKTYIRGNEWCYPFLLDKSISNCFRMKIDLNVSEYSGDAFGTWYLYLRDLGGHWTHVDSFEVDKSFLNNKKTIEFHFDPAVSFDAIAILRRENVSFSMSYSIKFYDAQHYVN